MTLNLDTDLGTVIVEIESDMDSTFKTVYTASVKEHRIVVSGDSVEQAIEEVYVSIKAIVDFQNKKK